VHRRLRRALVVANYVRRGSQTCRGASVPVLHPLSVTSGAALRASRSLGPSGVEKATDCHYHAKTTARRAPLQGRCENPREPR
jgi:hypothetical protein